MFRVRIIYILSYLCPFSFFSLKRPIHSICSPHYIPDYFCLQRSSDSKKLSVCPMAPVRLLARIHNLSWKCCILLPVTSSESLAWSPAGARGTSAQNCSYILRSGPVHLWRPCWCPTGSRERRRTALEGLGGLPRVRRVRSSWSSCIWTVCFGTIFSPERQGKGKSW